MRPQGQPWPGLNTRGGKLDPGRGELEDGSFNAVINEADKLEKRKGFVRGMAERFAGVVCGLFRYTSECGIEYVVVADQDGIKVRTPFDVPTFLGAESLPNDDFSTLDTTRWSPTDDYFVQQNALLLDINATISSNPYASQARLMQWFKPSAISSYFTEIEYSFVTGGSLQVASIAIKRTVATYLQANVLTEGTTYSVSLELVQSGVRTTLQTADLGGIALARGFLRLSFNAETRVATLRVIPEGGDQVTLTSTLSEAQANNLGQNTAIGLSRAAEDQLQIDNVTAGAL